MSIKLMSQVRQLDLRMSQKLVLMLMADNANDEGTHCFPSIRRLAHEAGCSVRTIITIIQELENQGIVKKAAKGNQYSPNQYHLKPSAGKKLVPFKSSAWVAADRASANTASSVASEVQGEEQVHSTTRASEAGAHITISNHQEPSLFTVETKQRFASSSTRTIPANEVSSASGGEPQARNPNEVPIVTPKRWGIVSIDPKTGGSIMGWSA